MTVIGINLTLRCQSTATVKAGVQAVAVQTVIERVSVAGHIHITVITHTATVARCPRPQRHGYTQVSRIVITPQIFRP